MILQERVPGSKCTINETVDKDDILITPSFNIKKSHQAYLKNEWQQKIIPWEQGIRNNSATALFHKLLINVVWIKSLNKLTG